MNEKTSRPIGVIILLILILFQALSGIGGGIGLVFDPSGESIGIPIDWLAGSPFSDYLIPGLILLFILGVFPLIVFYGLLKKMRYSWPGSLLIASALIIWIGVEILIIGYQAEPPLQLIYGVLGLILLILALLPSTQNYYRMPKK
jgi:FtsH-binding integral membrane protein